ncbi:hypothetical protein GCM10007392_29430 [Saccharospirillum salsuginis]|uniref:Uncharacterized protein n=1 Tax=Saccharospirillum salsuginis TaxID=418750 RepID=A0A918NB80_9GAMM|nr:hypothetical protein GCM10007392_29430 [Saccharospirillum salsuginis]
MPGTRAGYRWFPLGVVRYAAHSTRPWGLDRSILAADFPDGEPPASVAQTSASTINTQTANALVATTNANSVI